ncbi:MAG: universal stress protein [Bacteroidota bacterium]
MKNLLVPIDFSEAADNALEYAKLLAIHFDAKLTLVHAHSAPRDPMRIGIASEELFAEAESRLRRAAMTLRSIGLRVEEISRKGAVVATLKAVALKEKADLIVMGCQGKGYQPGKFMGSTTTTLMDEIDLPIMAVPHNFPPALPEQFVWATDLTPPKSEKVLFPLLRLIGIAKQELKVFHYQEGSREQALNPTLKERLTGVEYDLFSQSADGEKPEEAILEFVKMIKADVVTLIHRRVKWFSKLMVGSSTRKTVWTSPVPILILQEH